MFSREYLNFLNFKNAGFRHSGRMFALLQIWRSFWWPLLQTHYFFSFDKEESHRPTHPRPPLPRHLLTISYIYSLCIPLHFNLFTILWYVACYLHFVNRSFASNSVILKSFQSFNFKPQDFPLKLSRKTEVNLKFASKPEKIPSFCFKGNLHSYYRISLSRIKLCW